MNTLKEIEDCLAISGYFKVAEGHIPVITYMAKKALKHDPEFEIISLKYETGVGGIIIHNKPYNLEICKLVTEVAGLIDDICFGCGKPASKKHHMYDLGYMCSSCNNIILSNNGWV